MGVDAVLAPQAPGRGSTETRSHRRVSSLPRLAQEQADQAIQLYHSGLSVAQVGTILRCQRRLANPALRCGMSKVRSAARTDRSAVPDRRRVERVLLPVGTVATGGDH